MQHSEELLAIWRAKITSRADLERAVRESYRFDLPFDGITAGSYIDRDGIAGVRGLNLGRWELWTTSRDMVREHLGIYEPPTSVLTWLRGLGFMYQFPHISREDITKVAYSADTQGAQNDVKVRTTIGKLLRKLLPELNDDQVAQLSALHTSDLDPTFNIATDISEIELIYNNMQGDSGCMRYPRQRFHHTDYHPSAVYSSPGVGVAYLGTPESPTARCVVYTNPDNPEDKRFVRLYGNPVLASKLKRAGYRQAGLAGVRLKRFVDSGYGSSYLVMPYIDPPGGRGSGQTDCVGQNVVAFEGDDFVTVVSPEQTSRLQGFGVAVMSATSTEGHIVLCENRGCTVNTPDLLTGDAINLLGTGDVRRIVIEKDGDLAFGWTADMNTTDEWGGAHVVHPETNRVEYVLASDATLSAWCFPFNSSYLATPKTARYLGYYQLDPKRYGPRKFDTENEVVEVGDGVYVRRGDSMMVYNADGTRDYLPLDEEDRLRRENYVPTPNRNGMKVFAHPDCPSLVTLVSGRRAIRGVHDIVQLWDGRWCMRESTSVASIFGVTYYFLERDFDLPAEFWEKRAQTNTNDWPLSESMQLGMMRKPVKFDGYNSYVPTITKYDASGNNWAINLAGVYDISSTVHTHKNLIDSAEWIVAHQDETHQKVSPSDQVIAWAKCVLSLNRAVEAARAAKAAAEAVDQEDDDAPVEMHPDDALLAALDARLDKAPVNTQVFASASLFDQAAFERAKAAFSAGAPVTEASIREAMAQVWTDEATNFDPLTYLNTQIVVTRPDDNGVIFTNSAAA